MRLADCRNSRDHVKVTCLHCGRFQELAGMLADLDGPAFVAYFCRGVAGGPGCAPPSQDDADALYRAAGYSPASGVWRKA